ncbi:protein MULTIPLE CHLOROPLAST DIVISION SITE 1 [Impatiens glandulifera]|uniref:protein MULTIPLE CHLOROPLAST DIVISION SITE 1 n=1 Tax=Impatiens glandulifera TaxID=253017 RepID=UPI001FB06A0E|nr:protein MULTIPLE CHLOROPLAST DIVISION SITE 1 [Impatiens glandulifera]
MASVWVLQFHRFSFPLPNNHVSKHQFPSDMMELKALYRCGCNNWKPMKKMHGNFRVRAANDSLDSDDDKRVERETVTCLEKPQAMDLKNEVRRLQETIISLPPVDYVMKMPPRNKLIMGLCIVAMVLFIGVRNHLAKKAAKNRQPGSYADLVRRGQLRSDRRGISSKPLKYDDPFDNPLVKVNKSNSTMEMCGKVYKLAPVMLTKEQQTIHQKRRSRAYQWKRPTIFLKEGDPIPPDVDPDTIRWIPANHPFATTNNEIDEDMAQTNVYQKHGVPFRIQAEHEALQKKLESLQNSQKFSKLVLDPGSARDFERPFKLNMKSDEQIEPPSSASSDNEVAGPKQSNPGKNPGLFRNNPESEEMPKS